MTRRGRSPASPARRAWRVFLATSSLAWLAYVLFLRYFQRLWAPPEGWASLLAWSWEGEAIPYFILEAGVRAATSLAGAGALLAAAVLAGLGACRRLRWAFDSRAEALAVGASLGIGLFGLLGLLLAALGWYRPAPLAWMVILMGFLGLRWTFGGGTAFVTHAAESRTRARRGTSSWWVWAARLAMACALLAALAPPWEYDAVWYHLYFPRVYLEAGRLVDLPMETASLYPMTWNLWFGYGLVFGGPVAATLLHWACLPLTAAAIAQTVYRFVPQASARLAVALFAATPLVLWEASVAYLDLAIAFHTTVLLYALLRYVERPRAQWLLVAAFNLGVALASKHLALVLLAIAAPGLGLSLLLRRRGWGPMLGAPIALAVLALAVAAPWYWRSWAASGNPVFPELTEFFGFAGGRWSAQTEQGLQEFFSRFGHPRTLAHLLALPWDVTMDPARYGGILGPLFLLASPLLLLRRCRWGAGVLVAFSLVYVLLWASPLASFQMRWLVPAVPAFAILASLAFRRWQGLVRCGLGRLIARGFTGCMGLALLLQLPFFTPLHERTRLGWEGWVPHTLHGLPLAVVVGAEPARYFLARKIPTYAVWQIANRDLPLNAVVLTYSDGDHFYSLRRRLPAFAPQLRDVVWAPADQAEDALRRLRDWRVTHVLIRKDFLKQHHMDAPAGWERFALTSTATRQRWYERLKEDGHASLYRIRWEAAERAGQGVDDQPS
jgi:hypothetical protein